MPEQEHYLDYVIDHVARHSLFQDDAGWHWKFDPNLFAQFTGDVRGAALQYLGRIGCRLALLRSEKGLVTKDIGQFMYDRMGRVTPVVGLPESGHHAMLDQPLLLVTAIRTLLADWDHSLPPAPARGRGMSGGRDAVAVAPDDPRNAWLADAVRAGGGRVVDPSRGRRRGVGDPAPPRASGRAAGDSCPQIRWVQLPFAGIETFIHLTADGRTWTCGKGVYADPVAELALTLLLGGMRGMGAYARRTTWEKSDANELGNNLLGARVTILGGGGIAESLLRLLGGFGAATTVLRRDGSTPTPGADRTLGIDALHEVLAESDAVGAGAWR